MSSWTYMEIDTVPVVAKVGGVNKNESDDPVMDIADGKRVWLSGYQVDELDLRNGEEVEVYLPDIQAEYTGVVRDFSGGSKQVLIVSSPAFGLSMEEAEAAAFPGPGTIRRWHETPVEEGDRKSTWREYEDEAPPETLFKTPLGEGA